MVARAKLANPYTSAGAPAPLTANEAAEVAQKYVDMQRFLPLGDNHHNAQACPYCRGTMVLVALEPSLANRFVNKDGPWSFDDEKAMIEAVKLALANS
jgi:hypothetical protein